MPAIDEFDIEHGSADPNAGGDDVDWQAVESLVGLAIKGREEKAKAEQQAIRFAGHQEYQQLVEGGATPEEALRRTAHKLYYNSPQHLTAALRFSKPPPPLPTSIQAVPINDGEGQPIGMGVPNPRGGVHLLPQPRPAAAASARLAPEQQREVELARKDFTAAQTKLATAQSVLLKAKSERIKPKASALAEMERQVLDYGKEVEAAKQRFRSAGLGTPIAPAAQAPAAREARALPDSKDKLEANVTYKLPKGDFTWTGKGWIKAESALPLLPDEDIQDEE